MSRRGLPLLALAAALLGGAPALARAASAGEPAATSCVRCHGQADLHGEAADTLMRDFGASVHAAVGLACHDCHGGNPDPALADDMDAAMDPGYRPDPYRGAPAAAAVPDFCGRCHADVAFMRRYAPDPRVDQLQEYWTSGHGRALQGGDTAVATCVDCHGAHLVLRPEDNDAPVYPTRVAETCARCHADPQVMQGRGLPLDQYARWQRSVHAVALLDREDLFAPTCNDCHGNHGATPPGIESIAFVCGQCHGREAELFRASPKRPAFHTHNEYLASAGEEGCAACHEGPAAGFGPIESFSECSTCHGNHGVVRPGMSMLHPLPPTPCAFCHEAPDAESPEPVGVAEHYEQVKAGLLAEAGDRRGEDLFNWMVEQALRLEHHTEATEGSEERRPRDHFERLFRKFRIGQTTYAYEDPVSGEPVEAAIVRCASCHAAPAAGEADPGWRAGGIFLERMHALTSLTARAERLILAAERGGVAVGEAKSEIDRAVDAQIELEVLVHTFVAGEGSPFDLKHQEGLAHARAALQAGGEALDELENRHDGLKVSLVLILLLLVALALWIRRLTSDEPQVERDSV